ncbi:MAG: 3-deoxy-manno-octulosonate cytidylyltransferase [Flavobacteriales bacterium]
MKKIGIIPARYASTRFPGKPLVDIFGKTMIQRVFEKVNTSQLLDEVYVATDDQRIVDELESKNIPYILTDQNISTGTERCLAAARTLKSLEKEDILINIQGDEPFISANQIKLLLQAFSHPQTQIASLRKKIERIPQVLNPNSVKVVCDNNDFALYFSRSPIPYVRDTTQDQWLSVASFYKHLGIYAFKYGVLEELSHLEKSELEIHESLEQLSWLTHGYKIRMIITQEESPSIDTPNDLEMVLNLYKNRL